MAHLSNRHGQATRRRSDLLRDRMETLMNRSGQVVARSSPASSSYKKVVEVTQESSRPRRTPEEMAEFSRQCEQRVTKTRAKETLALQQVVAIKLERQSRSQEAGESATAKAAKRLRERRKKLRHEEETQLEALVEQQQSSLEAMNIVRMLSPRFQSHIDFTPAVVQYSADDERVQQLLASTHIGSFYP